MLLNSGMSLSDGNVLPEFAIEHADVVKLLDVSLHLHTG